MNISSEIFTNDGSNFTDDYFYNNTKGKTVFSVYAVDIMSILLGFPINSYVIWLIVTGTGNGLAAEFFSLNLAVCEIILCLKSVLIFISYKCEILSDLLRFLDVLAVTGRPLFQCLICVERYLAVVHPITFLKFKPLRYKAICSAIAWVVICVSGGINIMTWIFFLVDFNVISMLGLFPVIFFIQLFCLVAVLRALNKSGPGERGRERNNMKRRAFLIILITTVTMLIIFFPFAISVILISLGGNPGASLSIGYVCFFLAGVVQPLLFFYRIGKLC